MKQKSISFLLAILMSMAANVAMAYDAEIDGIYYNFNGTEAIVTYGNNQYSGDVVIPETVTYNEKECSVVSIGDCAFRGCSNLTSVTIPESITTIGDCAFRLCSCLTSITIPNRVTSIGEGTFYGCSSITSITIGNSVTRIGEYTFGLCTNLTAITIPNNVTSIGDCAFRGCSNLTSVTIGKSVTSIEGSVFLECDSLTDIVVEEENPKYDSRNNCNAIIETSSNTLFKGCKNTTIPNSVTSIGEYAFRGCSGLTAIAIPNSVTTIGEWSFSGCSSLASITFGNSLMSIESYAFSGCSSLASITFGNSVTSIKYYAFYGCSGLASITIPSSVTSIEDNAFGGCSGLTSIVVEDGNPNYDSRNNCNAIIVTSSNELVVGCKGTTIPSSVTRIGHHAFYYRDGLTSVMIPNSVKSIGVEAFYGCKGLTSITIPSSVTIIGSGNLCGCSDLTSIVVEEGNPNYDSRNNCNAIIETSSNSLMAGCQNTTIPGSVKSIGGRAFYGCSSLTSITIPNNVTSIGGSAFWGCSSLTSVTILGSVTSIGGFTFMDCSNLTSVTIPNSVTSIGWSAFGNCSNLTSVTIPINVKNIEYLAFSNCSSLTDVYCYARIVPTTDSNAFSGTSIYSMTLHVPSGSIDAYKTTAPWNDFKEIVESDYLNVADMGLKAGDSNVQEISLNNSHTNFVAFQMDLALPDGVGIDKSGCMLSSRITDDEQELTIGKLESGAYRITSASLSLTPISGNDGTLLTLKLTAEDGCIGGQAIISNIIFSTAESEKVMMSDKAFDISILYNLTYKVDGEEYKNYEVEYGTIITPEAEPTKEGYTFSGWSEIPETMPAHDVTISGTFTINKYKLTYIVDGEEYKTYEVEYGTTITPESEPTKEGYTFSGWSEIPETMPAHDVTVTGTFTINKYKLTYTVDGEEYKNYEVEYGTAITPEAEPTKEGYTFSGWSEIPETMPAHDVTVTGTFGINTYKLTYMIDDAVYKVVDYKYGETITPEPAPEGNYASFEWVGLPETMPAKDVTVYANYVTGITDVVMKENIVRIFSPNGKVLDKLQKGLNIVLMKDGTIKKILVK